MNNTKDAYSIECNEVTDYCCIVHSLVSPLVITRQGRIRSRYEKFNLSLDTLFENFAGGEATSQILLRVDKLSMLH